MFWTECALKLVVSTSNIFTNPKVALETVTVLHQLSWLQTHKQKHMISLYKVSFWSHSQKHQELNYPAQQLSPIMPGVHHLQSQAPPRHLAEQCTMIPDMHHLPGKKQHKSWVCFGCSQLCISPSLILGFQ